MLYLDSPLQPLDVDQVLSAEFEIFIGHQFALRVCRGALRLVRFLERRRRRWLVHFSFFLFLILSFSLSPHLCCYVFLFHVLHVFITLRRSDPEQETVRTM